MNAMKWGRTGLLAAPLCACLVLTGCKDDGDDDLDTNRGDGGGGVVVPDAGIDGSVPGDAGYKDLVIKPVAISAAGHDRFQAVTFDEAGNIFAAGYTAPGTAQTDDSSFVLAKFSANGELDKSFGGSATGFVTRNVTERGQNVEQAFSVLVVKAGAHKDKIVVAGEADHAPLGMDAGAIARDTDVVVLRYLPNGTLDTTFGTGGEVRLQLSDAIATSTTNADGGVQETLNGADKVWSVGQTSDGKLVLHGASRAAGAYADGGVRLDTDFTLVRLLDTGALDTGFAGTGIVTTDVAQVNGSARAATVLADDGVVAVGYTPGSSPLLAPNGQQPVLYKVTKDGARDGTFADGGLPDQVATPGVWHGYARTDTKNAEAYGAAPQQDGKFVTVGYGPTPGSGQGSDWVFFRFNPDGTQDKTFGTGGETFIDPAKLADNGRAVAILPDNRVLGVGVGRRAGTQPAADGGTPAPNVDGMLAVLTPQGQPDTSFGEGGFRLLDWGTNDTLSASAVAPSKRQVAIVGGAGGRADKLDDDGVIVLWSLP